MATNAIAVKRRAPRPERIRRWLPLYLMMLPGALYLIVNNYLPMAGLVIAFKQVDFKRAFSRVTGRA